MFEKVDGFIKEYNGTKYLALFGSEKYNAIFDRIRYLIRLKSLISHVVSQYFGKIIIDSDDDLPLKKTLTFHDVVILIKSVFNKNRFFKSNFFIPICPVTPIFSTTNTVTPCIT